MQWLRKMFVWKKMIVILFPNFRGNIDFFLSMFKLHVCKANVKTSILSPVDFYQSIYLFIYIHVHTYIHTNVRTYIRQLIYVHTHTYIQTYIHTYIHVYTLYRERQGQCFAVVPVYVVCSAAISLDLIWLCFEATTHDMFVRFLC